MPFTGDETCAVKFTDCPIGDGFAFEVSVVSVAAGPTVCANAAEVLVRKWESPLYFAVSECEPSISGVVCVLKVATPPDRLPLPSEVLPSKKVTLPVGAPPYAGVTVAVKVTTWPYEEGLVLELTVVDVPA